MDLKSSTSPRLERCFCPLVANSQAQLRIILIRISCGNWAKNSSIRPGGNGVVVFIKVMDCARRMELYGWVCGGDMPGVID